MNLPAIEIDDNYDHLDPSIEYIMENILYIPSTEVCKSSEYKALEELFNSVLTNYCHCYSFDCANEDTSSKCCPHGGNYKIIEDKMGAVKELVLNNNRPSKDLIYECSTMCKCCSTTCRNRLSQYGPRKNLKIIDSRHLHKQKSLTTTKSIPKGAFICEYAGEILTRTEAKRREAVNNSRSNDSNKMNYVMCLNEYSLKDIAKESNDSTERAGTGGENLWQTIIDPSKKGNIGRYLNHSCDPNCEILSVRVDGPIPKIGIFAIKDIDKNEELCFHYGGGAYQNQLAKVDSDTLIPCLCGAKNCQRFLPNLEF